MRRARLLRAAALVCVSALALAPAVARALEVEVSHAPTELGQPSEFTATVSASVGDVEYRWDFGDGSEATPWSTGQDGVAHTYAAPGHYTVNLLVRDAETPFAGHASTHTVIRPVTPGQARASTTIVYDDARRLVINANLDNDTVTVIDADALRVVAELPVYDHPSSLALAPDGRLWVAHQDDFAVAIIDLDALAVVGGLRLPYASQPAGIVFDSRRAYISLQALGAVVDVDAETLEQGAPLIVGPWARGLALSADERTLYVTHFISGQDAGAVSVVDVPTMTVRSTASLVVDPGPDTDQSGRGVPNYLFSVAITPDGEEAWVTGKKDNVERGLARDGLPLTEDNTVRPMLASLDTATGLEELARRLDIDDRNLPSHVTFSPLGDYAFVTVTGSSFINVRDRYGARTSVADLKEAGLAPRASALSPDGALFVHGWLSRTVVVFDVSQILASVDFKAVRVAELEVVGAERLAPEVLAGKRIFYNSEDTRMTEEGYISCGTCHFDGFEDGRVYDFTDRGEGLRNNISLLGRRGTGHGRVHWSGNFDEIQDFEHDIRGPFGGSGFMDDADFESGTTGTPLGDPKSGKSRDLDALAAYVASLSKVHPSPYRDADGPLTPEASAGRALFVSDALGCASCHVPQRHTDSSLCEVPFLLHDVGTLKPSSGGRLGGPLLGIDTPTLNGVWETGPYLHDGSA
ncbi:MAG: PKD domain-containing protein, partial [Myxococcales bacterium]|nr:PKD domain-containing protein [Myxococcales bacterium]